MRFASRVLIFLSLSWNAPVALAKLDNPEKQLHEVLKTVPLNADQKGQIRQIKDGGRAHLQALRDEVDQRKRELNQLLDTNGSDGSLHEAFQKLQNAKRSLEAARFERMLSIRSILSEQQKSAFQSLRQSRSTL